MWVCEELGGIEEITAFLNALPGDRASDAKVVASSSSINGGGWFYYVWYRK